MEQNEQMQGLQVPQSKNGICSAHPLLIQELRDINQKLDNLTNDDIKEKARQEFFKPWIDRGIGVCLVLIPLIVFELIKYYTFL